MSGSTSRRARSAARRCPSSFRQLVAPPPPATRLSRAALYALRVGVLSSAAVACGGSLSPGGSEKDSGPDDNTATLPDASYGGPPPSEAGGDDDAQYGVLYGAFATDANYAVPYGLPAQPPDAGMDDGPSDASCPPRRRLHRPALRRARHFLRRVHGVRRDPGRRARPARPEGLAAVATGADSDRAHDRQPGWRPRGPPGGRGPRRRLPSGSRGRTASLGFPASLAGLDLGRFGDRHADEAHALGEVLGAEA